MWNSLSVIYSRTWKKQQNQNWYIRVVIVMDSAKAFDKVPHNRLLSKLPHLDFLTSRTQTVIIDARWCTTRKKLCNIWRSPRVNSKTVKEKAYTSLVRPKLEFSCCLWDPHPKTQIHQLEMVQHRAVRYTCNIYHNTSSVIEMLQTLNWSTFKRKGE